MVALIAWIFVHRTKFLQTQSSRVTEYDEQMVRRLIEKITVFDDKLIFKFKSGMSIEARAYLEKSSTSDATRSATRGKTTSMRSRSSVKSARAQDCQSFYKLFCPQEGAANRIKSSLTKAVPHYGTAFLHCRTPPLYIFSILTMIKIKNNESRSKGLSRKNNIMRRI